MWATHGTSWLSLLSSLVSSPAFTLFIAKKGDDLLKPGCIRCHGVWPCRSFLTTRRTLPQDSKGVKCDAQPGILRERIDLDYSLSNQVGLASVLFSSSLSSHQNSLPSAHTARPASTPHTVSTQPCCTVPLTPWVLGRVGHQISDDPGPQSSLPWTPGLFLEVSGLCLPSGTCRDSFVSFDFS